MSSLLEIKSKFRAEFRRISINISEFNTFEKFYRNLEDLHRLQDTEFVVKYIDPKDNELLPINNDSNLSKAFEVIKTVMRILILIKGETTYSISSSTLPFFGKKDAASVVRSVKQASTEPHISLMDDFHQVSSIIDVDLIPENMRRVKLTRKDSRPIGFYIRSGVTLRMEPNGMRRVPGVFISRLTAGGLAESTGLLAVNDEVIEVNGIPVSNKSLDQVTDMMVANSSNLIITVRPCNQNTCLPPKKNRNSFLGPMDASTGGNSLSSESMGRHTVDIDEQDEGNGTNGLITL